MSGDFDTHDARTDMAAWLGDTYTSGELSDEQLRRFAAVWDRVGQIWSDRDHQNERTAALSAAVRYLSGEADETDIGHELMKTRTALSKAKAAARIVATLAFEDGATKVDLARDLGVDRARTLRSWLGK